MIYGGPERKHGCISSQLIEFNLNAQLRLFGEQDLGMFMGASAYPNNVLLLLYVHVRAVCSSR